MEAWSYNKSQQFECKQTYCEQSHHIFSSFYVGHTQTDTNCPLIETVPKMLSSDGFFFKANSDTDLFRLDSSGGRESSSQISERADRHSNLSFFQ